MAPVQTGKAPATITVKPRQETVFSIRLLWASGVAPRKGKVAPTLDNRAFDEYTALAAKRLLDMDIRLQIAERILMAPDGPLFSEALKAQYRKRLDEEGL